MGTTDSAIGRDEKASGGHALACVGFLESMPADCRVIVSTLCERVMAMLGDLRCSRLTVRTQPECPGTNSTTIRGKLSSQIKQLSEGEPVESGSLQSLTLASPSVNADVYKTPWTLRIEDRAYALGVEVDPMVMMRVDIDLFNDPADAMHLVSGVFESIDAYTDCYQGLVDVSTIRDMNGALMYTSFLGEPTGWGRGIEMLEWLLCDQSTRRHYVRGDYWGIYLGPALTGRMEQGLTEFSKQSRVGKYTPQTVRRFVRGGTLVTLTADPLDMCSDLWQAHPVALDSMVWLRSSFRQAGVLWPGLSAEEIRSKWDTL